MAGLGGGAAEGGATHSLILAWREAHAKLGRYLELGERLSIGFHCYIAESREQGSRISRVWKNAIRGSTASWSKNGSAYPNPSVSNRSSASPPRSCRRSTRRKSSSQPWPSRPATLPSCNDRSGYIQSHQTLKGEFRHGTSISEIYGRSLDVHRQA